MKSRIRVGVVLLVAVLAVGSLAWVAVAQDARGGAGSVASTSDVAAGFSAAQTKLGELQKSIGAAIEKLKVAGGTAAEREKVVDEFIARLKEADASMNEKSDLSNLIQQSINNNQEKQAEYEKNASDPSLLPDIRENYERLKSRFQRNVAGLVDKKLLLGKEVAKLQDNIKLFTQQKKLFGDLVLADMTEEANKLVEDVVLKAVDLNAELGKMAREIGKPGPDAKKDVTPERR